MISGATALAAAGGYATVNGGWTVQQHPLAIGEWGSGFSRLLHSQPTLFSWRDGGSRAWTGRAEADSPTAGFAKMASVEIEGASGGVEGNVGSDLSAKKDGGEAPGFSPSRLFQGMEDVAKRAEVLKEEVSAFNFGFSPTPYAPAEGPDAFRFAILCALLLFIFWLGNYLVPDLIFKDTVFKKDGDEPSDSAGKASEDKSKLEMSNDRHPEEFADGDGNGKGDTASQVGQGFGQRKRRRQKSSKRK